MKMYCVYGTLKSPRLSVSSLLNRFRQLGHGKETEAGAFNFIRCTIS
jgi:hypothetical protein